MLTWGVGIAMQRMHQSYKWMKAQQKKTSGCASNLLAHEDLWQFKEVHYWNIQAKFYNVKFPLVYESDNICDSLYEEHGATLKHNIWDSLYHGATLKHKCGKRIVALPLLFIFFFGAFFFFFGLSLSFFLFFFLLLGQCSRKWWSWHFRHWHIIYPGTPPEVFT